MREKNALALRNSGFEMAEGYETHKALYTYSDPENPQILPIRTGDYLEQVLGIEPPEGWLLMR